MTRYSSNWHGKLWIHLVARIAAGIWRWNNDRLGQRPLLGRLTAHVAIAFILAGLLFLGSLKLDSLAAVSLIADKALLKNFTQNVDAASTASAMVERSYYRTASQARIVRQAQSHTYIPERPRLELTTYTVQAGDTTEGIAESFGLQPTTLLWANSDLEKMPDLLRVGQALTILPIDGVYHTIAEGDTLESLAEKYKVDVETIRSCEFNTIPTDGVLVTGEKLIIPGGTKPYETRKVTAYSGEPPVEASASGWFYWPASGVLTQGYWYGHRAIDIGSAIGSPVIASDGGYTSFAGWTDIGYGYLIVVEHGNGYQTFYAHLSNIFVFEGQAVTAGQVIGAMGSTGNSTGPHLHFEIRYNGYPTNPLIYLR